MPGWTRSLRWRLLGATLLTVALALAGAGWSLVQLFRDHAQAQFEAQLLMQLDQLTAAFELDEQQRPRLSSPLSDPRWQKPYSGLYWQIEAIPPSPDQADLQHTVWRSRSLWDHELLLPDDQLNTEELTWDPVQKKIYSDKFVRIRTADEILLGTGFESDQEFKRYRILNPEGTLTIHDDE